jgi:peptidoglycan/LPS O-acetylase OafA/YrhL
VPDKGRIPALDGVRGLAVLVVIAFHCRELLPVNSPAFLQAFSYGWSGVDLFFVLSGFLITGILLDTRESPSYFRTFYARRALRIFPLYFVYLVPALLFTHSAHAWGWYVTYLMNWRPGYGMDTRFLAHLWSLAVEEQFYLAWPAIVWITPRRVLPYVCASLALIALACRAFAPEFGLSPYHVTPCRMDTLALGAVAAIAVRDFPRLARRWVAPIAALGIVAFEAIIRLAGEFGDFWWSLPARTIGDTLIAVLSTCLVLHGATVRSGLLYWLLTSRPLRVCGKYSYAMYVLQEVVVYPLARAVIRVWGFPSGAGFLLYFGCAALGVLGLGWISWKLIEEPFHRLKGRFPYSAAGTGKELARPGYGDSACSAGVVRRDVPAIVPAEKGR